MIRDVADAVELGDRSRRGSRGLGGAVTGSSGMSAGCAADPAAFASPRAGTVPSSESMNRARTLAVGAMLPPPAGNGRTPAHGNRSSIAGGWLVDESLLAKQSPPADGAPSARSAGRSSNEVVADLVAAGRPEVRVEIGTTRCRRSPESSTRFPTMRLSRPPATRIPAPKRDVLVLLSVGRVGLLSWTWFPAITASRCGGYGSESSVFGTIPARFSCHSLFTIARSPPAFVPEYPERVVSARHVGDHRVARGALPDVEAGVG